MIPQDFAQQQENGQSSTLSEDLIVVFNKKFPSFCVFSIFGFWCFDCLICFLKCRKVDEEQELSCSLVSFLLPCMLSLCC
jgi:hypothetical protein